MSTGVFPYDASKLLPIWFNVQYGKIDVLINTISIWSNRDKTVYKMKCNKCNKEIPYSKGFDMPERHMYQFLCKKCYKEIKTYQEVKSE